jgi:hypothetical protein
MKEPADSANLREKEAEMHFVVLVIVFAFVFAVLALVGFALFEMSPFASHNDHYRDPETGKRLFGSPHLD